MACCLVFLVSGVWCGCLFVVRRCLLSFVGHVSCVLLLLFVVDVCDCCRRC